MKKFKNYYWILVVFFILLQVKFIHTFAFEMSLIPIASDYALFLTAAITLNTYYFMNKGINNYKKVFSNKTQFVLFSILVVIISFFVGGHQLFMSGNGWNINKSSIQMFIYLIILVYPIIYDFIILLDNINIKEKIKNKKSSIKNDYRIVFIVSFLISFVINFLAGVGFYPGNMTSDSVDIIAQALGNISIGGGHPPFNTLLLRMVYIVCPNPFAGIVACDLFLALVVAYIFSYLRKNGLNRIVSYMAAFVFTIMGNNLVLMTILWKDIPFTISLLWLTFEMYKVVKEKEDYFKLKRNILLLIIALMFTYFIRYNGIFPYYLCVGYLIYLAFKFVQKKSVIITIVLSIISILIVKYPVYNMLHIERMSYSGGASSFALKGVAALVYYDVDLSKEDQKIIDRIADRELIKESYSKYNIDTLSFDENGKIIMEGASKVSTFEFYKLYIKHLFLHPGVIIKDRLDSNNLLWSYITPDDGFNSTYAIGVWYTADYDYKLSKLPEPNDMINNVYNPKKNIINKKMMELIEFIDTTPLYFILWRAAFPLTLLLILMYYNFKNKILLWPVFYPTIISILFWGALLSHQSYRYLWFIFVNTYVLYIFSLKEKKNS